MSWLNIKSWGKKKFNRILHISDTHGYHDQIVIDGEVDIIIHSGDYSNEYLPYKNEKETKEFLEWFGGLNIKYKILISGNHDAYAYTNRVEFKQLCDFLGIIYLEDSFTIVEGLKIYGSPTTPTYGNWYFMKQRHVIEKVWKNIPDDTDILVTHGPPKGILDSVERSASIIERTGCSALLNHIVLRIKPELVCFGHIHNNNTCINNGVLIRNGIKYSNASVVTDNKFGTLSSQGNYFIISNNNKK